VRRQSQVEQLEDAVDWVTERTKLAYEEVERGKNESREKVKPWR